MAPFKRPKYRNKKVVNEYGTFDSTLEANRYIFLLMLSKSGAVSDLERQKEFVVIPAQSVSVERTGKRGQSLAPKTKVVERECRYRADFVYRYNGQTIIEDTKGYKTPEYILKRKLMRLQGNPIFEVTRYNQQPVVNY